MCGGVVVRPCRDGASASGRGVLSMHGLSHGVVRVNTGSNLTSLTLQDCGQVLPGGLYISPYVSVCLLHICRTVDRCYQEVCISLCAFLSVCLFLLGDPQDGRWKITLMFDGRRFCMPKFRYSTLRQMTRHW